jgi:hypothetical protein
MHYTRLVTALDIYINRIAYIGRMLHHIQPSYIYLFFPAARCLLCYIWYTCLYTASTTTTTMAAPPQPKTLLGRYRPLAPTASVKVSPLCLGAMSFGQAW